MHVDLGDEVAHHRHVEGLGHARDLHPLGDAAHAQQIDHRDVDRPVLEELAERGDAVDVLARGNGHRQRVGDRRQPRIVVVGRRIFQPEEVVRLDARPDVDGLLDPPELVDVAHEVDVVADGLPHHAHALDLARGQRLGAALHLHLAEAHALEARAGFGEIVHGMRAHQGPARIGGHAVAMAAEQRGERLAEGLALDVPQRDVHRGEREPEDAAGPGAPRRLPELGGDRLAAQRVLADGEARERIHRFAQRPRQRAAEEGEADAGQSLIGAELEGDEVAGGIAVVDAHDQRVVGGGADQTRGDVADLHRSPPRERRVGGGTVRRRRRRGRAPGRRRQSSRRRPRCPRRSG